MCTVREFSKLWICNLQPDTRSPLTNVPDGSTCTETLIIIIIIIIIIINHLKPTGHVLHQPV
jgi:hypothetical protein